MGFELLFFCHGPFLPVVHLVRACLCPRLLPGSLGSWVRACFTTALPIPSCYLGVHPGFFKSSTNDDQSVSLLGMDSSNTKCLLLRDGQKVLKMPKSLPYPSVSIPF